ncbi:protein kinase [Streptomyces sp. NPDC056656]|uniref:serine/threonine-protein kinase n=1 Tax=Streptomyces sp. NPDC056656 TaxID=3345895 RepID=UPI0036BE610E
MADHEVAALPPVDELAGRYRLAELLGRGGMGEVWSATDSVLRRSVAVKLLSLLSGADLERRFQREAAILAGLRHPGITVVHDAGRHSGFLFIVMELLEGADLGKLLAEHPGGVPLQRALDLAAQTAEAVGAAHGSGVVHRDLKPANVFVQAGDRVKVCDFGIARSAGATSALTATGLIIGTPPYMSPEQCRGGEVDARSDLYSLGCALFEMLTGATPFRADQSVYALLHQHISDPPPRLSELRPDMPAALVTLVSALLAKDPDARPASAARVAEELAALRGGRVPSPTVPVVAIAPALRISRLIDDPETKAMALAVLIVAVAVTDPDAAEALVAEFPALYRPFALAEFVAALDDPPRIHRLLEQADALTAAPPADQPELRAEILLLLGRLWIDLDPARAVHTLERASECIPLIDDESAYGRAKDLAEAAGLLAAADHAEAERLMGGIERIVAALDVEVGHPTFLARKLAEIALAGRAADPAAAERLLRRAEQTAEQDEHSQTALEFLAAALAVADMPRARLILDRIISDHDRITTWAGIIKAIGAHQPDLLDQVLDAFELDRPVQADPPAPNPDPGPPARGVRRLFGRTAPPTAPQPAPATTVTEEDGPFSLMYVAEAAAPFAADRAERIASRIVDTNYRTQAFLRMANEVAKDRPPRARRWLRRAYQSALETAKVRPAFLAPVVPGLMGQIAESAVVIAPDIAEDAAEYIAELGDRSLNKESAYTLARIAEGIAVVDPRGAIRLVDLIEGRHDALTEDVRQLIAEAQVGAAATLARSDLDSAADTIRRAARAIASMTSMQRVSWVDWDPVARLAAKRRDAAVQLSEWVLEHVQGETRDHVLKALASAFASVDLPRAEQLAGAVVDRSIRDEALSDIVAALVEESEKLASGDVQP